MTQVEVYLCDLCEADGEKVFATHRYWSDDGAEWHCCKKHLAVVKEVGVEVEALEESG